MIAMMIFIHLIVLLIIGFGVGYWLLITANTHEGRLRTIGESLGFVLIGMVTLYAILGFFYAMKISDSDYMPGVGQQKTQMLNNEGNRENDNLQNNEARPMMNNQRSEDNGETQDASQENGLVH
jgi:hypothetical protein